MPVRIGIHGACGRMGTTVGRLAAGDARFRITAALERAGHPRLGVDYGTVLGRGALGICVADDWESRPDVLIDFTAPGALNRILPRCVREKVALVVGTTGLGRKEMGDLARAARKIPVLVASNMSVGMNLLFRLAGEVARWLGPEFDVEIVETHHRHKKDAPSGSALTLSQEIVRARKASDRAVILSRRGMVGERPRGEIGIHAVRGGDIVGEHVVAFIGEGETVELVHRARTREIFARGALQAAARIRGRKPGRYDFRQLLL